MTKPRAVVVDTNIVVAGLLTAEPSSPTCRVLDGMLEGRFVFLLCEALLAEYRAVLLRPAIRQRHGLDEAEVDGLLAELVRNGIVREPARAAAAGPDAGDQHLWELAGCEAGSAVVTGDLELVNTPPGGARVLSARLLVELLEAR